MTDAEVLAAMDAEAGSLVKQLIKDFVKNGGNGLRLLRNEGTRKVHFTLETDQDRPLLDGLCSDLGLTIKNGAIEVP